MKHSVKIVGAGIFILVSFLYVYPQGWRGIVPLKSTRADVVKILGKPSRFGYVYDFDKGAIRIMYSRKRCEQGLPSDWGTGQRPKIRTYFVKRIPPKFVTDFKTTS